MSPLPDDLYDRVFELATDLTCASEAEDKAAYAEHFAELRALHEQLVAAGQGHPFVTEALADYTDDTSAAIDLYRLALAQSAGHPDEPTHTKHLCLAERLIECGAAVEAREHLALGRAQALAKGDADWLKRADELYQTLVA